MPELLSAQHEKVFEEYYVPQLKKGLSANEEMSKQKCLMQIHKVEKDLAQQLASYTGSAGLHGMHAASSRKVDSESVLEFCMPAGV